jgi:hypothetical protein
MATLIKYFFSSDRKRKPHFLLIFKIKIFNFPQKILQKFKAKRMISLFSLPSNLGVTDRLNIPPISVNNRIIFVSIL